NSDAMVHLSSRTFDRIINLDAGKISAGMATMAKAKEKIGYILHERGYVTGTNSAADDWLRMGIFDDIKKKNDRTYQEIMCAILELPPNGLKYILELTEEEKEKGRSHLLDLGINLEKSIIGIHTGGGGRWRLKQWNEENFVKLIENLSNEFGKDIQICLFGGPLEMEQNKRIINRIKGPLFDTGCENTVRHLASMIKYCSVILSGDSLAMHLALAMERQVVVLFGPTSHAEIELFGLGEKVIPDLDCLVCYKKECDFSPNCMDSISVAMVKEKLLRQINFSH
ncbi:MAG TPA: glycosyltransferase family 9 protein, partial [Ignavibacteriaceae bacterium]|nr:glycosyltransferase family 9 protein [Ignavibacteriaceae bacterium]